MFRDMHRYYRAISVVALLAGLALLHPAITNPEPTSALGYFSLWAGSVGLISLSFLMNELAKRASS